MSCFSSSMFGLQIDRALYSHLWKQSARWSLELLEYGYFCTVMGAGYHLLFLWLCWCVTSSFFLSFMTHNGSKLMAAWNLLHPMAFTFIAFIYNAYIILLPIKYKLILYFYVFFCFKEFVVTCICAMSLALHHCWGVNFKLLCLQCCFMKPGLY